MACGLKGTHLACTLALGLLTCLIAGSGTVCQGSRVLQQTLGRAADFEQKIESSLNPSDQGSNPGEGGQKAEGKEGGSGQPGDEAQGATEMQSEPQAKDEDQDKAKAEAESKSSQHEPEVKPAPEPEKKAEAESNNSQDSEAASRPSTDADAESQHKNEAEGDPRPVDSVDAESEPELWPRNRCKSMNLSELVASLSDLHLMFHQGDIHKLHEYPIPRFIHQTAKGTRDEYKPEPPMGRWPEKHQGYTHIVWSDASVERFLEMCIPEFLPLFKGAPAGIFRSDMMRYLLLLAFGGIWGDGDTEPLRPFDDWLNGVEGDSMHAKIRLITGVESDDPNWQNSGYGARVQLLQWTFAAAPGHPVLWYAVQQLVVNLERLLREVFELPSSEDSSGSPLGEAEELWKSGPKLRVVFPEPGAPMKLNMTRSHVLATTGPWLWTRAVLWKLKQGGWSTEDIQDLTVGKTFDDLVVLPITGFSPGWGRNSKPDTDPEARVKHHFSGSWLGQFI